MQIWNSENKTFKNETNKQKTRIHFSSFFHIFFCIFLNFIFEYFSSCFTQKCFFQVAQVLWTVITLTNSYMAMKMVSNAIHLIPLQFIHFHSKLRFSFSMKRIKEAHFFSHWNVKKYQIIYFDRHFATHLSMMCVCVCVYSYLGV